MADTDLIERVNVIAGLLVLSPEQSEALMDAATALAEKDARIAEWQEPPLTCPHIDAAIASGELSDGVKAELAEIRDINSQLRYGTWALRSQLTASRAECEGLRAALKPFACEASEWSWKFGDEQQVSCRPGPPHDDHEVARFTVGDLRRALASLSQPAKGEQP